MFISHLYLLFLLCCVQVSADDYSERLQDQVSQRLETLGLIKRRVAARRRHQAAQASL